MSCWRTFRRLFLVVTSAAVCLALPAIGDEQVYGPINLLKTMATPFGSPLKQSESKTHELAPMSLALHSTRNLTNRLLPPRVYLPGRMLLGQTAEFIVKGPAGSWAALAMADKDSGAKPIYGHQLHLGPDRKLVALAKIPESGILPLNVDTPIEGDMIGQSFYFEVAIWSKADFSDLELAVPVASESAPDAPKSPHPNGVLVAAEPTHKRGIRIVPDGTIALPQIPGHGTSIDSGRP